MNENLFEEIPATVPQHTRRIVVDDDQGKFVAYCTVCAWYSYTGDDHTVTDVLVSWVTHLEKVIAYRNQRYAETQGEDFHAFGAREHAFSPDISEGGSPALCEVCGHIRSLHTDMEKWQAVTDAARGEGMVLRAGPKHPKQGDLITNTRIDAGGMPITTVEVYEEPEFPERVQADNELRRDGFSDTELDAKGHPV